MITSRADRAIDNRYVPPVAGIDLEQALNYVDLDVAGEAFVYDHYTSGRTFYVSGSRPRLEQVVARTTADASTDLQTIQMLATWLADHVRWAGYGQEERGDRLATDQSPSEERLLDARYGWCNEQARLFCALSQVAGIPSRIVFAFNKARRYGHCVSEVLLADDRWMAVDQSLGFCFAVDSEPVRASRIYRDPAARRHFTPIYAERCRRLMDDLGKEVHADFAMAASDDPLDGFASVGFHNYFIH
jgi:transglutaminase-like putative cysteine protease